MKKINSLHFSISVLRFIIITLIIIPMLCMSSQRYIRNNLLFNLSLVVDILSIVIGALALTCLIIVWIIEYWQDRYMNKFYTENQNIKIKLSKNKYECQTCGSRMVKHADKSCLTCGTAFKKGENNDDRPKKWYLR